MPETSPELITVKAAAEHAGRHPLTIRRYIREGRLSRYRSGPRQVLVDRAEINALTRIEHARTIQP